MGEELIAKVRSLVQIIKYQAGDYILKEGDVCNKACLIVKGLTRSFYINEEKDITSRFMEEGNIVTSWPSYYIQQPGNEFIEAIEDTTVACLDYISVQKLYAEFQEFNTIGRRQVEYAFFLSEQRTQMLRKHTAIEKYEFFITNHPTLLQRVPLKHIATYLGMTEETLSRVRRKHYRNNS